MNRAASAASGPIRFASLNAAGNDFISHRTRQAAERRGEGQTPRRVRFRMPRRMNDRELSSRKTRQSGFVTGPTQAHATRTGWESSSLNPSPSRKPEPESPRGSALADEARKYFGRALRLGFSRPSPKHFRQHQKRHTQQH